jgi:hypothetical protein
MGWKEELDKEVAAITKLIDEALARASALKTDGCDPTQRQDFRASVQALAVFTGINGSTASAANTEASSGRSRLTAEEIAELEIAILGIVEKSGKDGIRPSEIKESVNALPNASERFLADKVNSRLTKLKNDGRLKYVAGESKRDGGTYFKK